MGDLVMDEVPLRSTAQPCAATPSTAAELSVVAPCFKE
jgi:hypothetical protein